MAKLLKRFIFLPLLMLVSLLSCSSHAGRPYASIEGDPYETRLYRLSGGVKVFVTCNDVQPRVTAALCLPSVVCDTLERLLTPSVRSQKYNSLFASIGTDVSDVTEIYGSTIISNDIPCNEIENWARIISGSLMSLPDSAIFIISGAVDAETAVAAVEKQISAMPLTSAHTAAIDASTADKQVALLLSPSNITSSESARLYVEKLLFGEKDNCFRTFAIAEAVLRGAAWNDAYLRSERLKMLDSTQLAGSRKLPPMYRRGRMPEVTAGAENNITLLPSPPAPVVFPDTGGLQISSTDASRLICNETDDTLFTLALRYSMQQLSPSFISHFATFLDEKIGGAAIVHADGAVLQFSLEGVASAQQHSVNEFFATLDTILNNKNLYRQLCADKGVVDATKNKFDNIAEQFARYTHGDQCVQGAYEATALCAAALFAPPTEILYYGNNSKNVVAAISKRLPLNERPIQSVARDDTIATICLLPMDTEDARSVVAVPAAISVDDHASILLFNKSASLAGAIGKHYPSGAYSFSGVAAGEIPFTREEFDAAKSYLLYACSTLNRGGYSLVEESLAAYERGYTASELYDALSSLGYSDVKEYHQCQTEKSSAQLIVGRQNCIRQQNIARQNMIIHLTSDELFGY